MNENEKAKADLDNLESKILFSSSLVSVIQEEEIHSDAVY